MINSLDSTYMKNAPQHSYRLNIRTSLKYVQLTLSILNLQGTREFVRDRERKIGYRQHKGTETLVRAMVRDIKKFEIEGVRDRES